MSGRRCGDLLGERCKRSQRLQLDLACGPRCICCKHAGSGRATPARTCPRPPSRAIEREACLISFHVLMLSNINRTSSVGATFGLNSICNRSPLEQAAGECGSGYALRAQTWQRFRSIPRRVRVVSDNRIQLKFRTKDFEGEYFHYTGDLFFIYKSGHLMRLMCKPE